MRTGGCSCNRKLKSAFSYDSSEIRNTKSNGIEFGLVRVATGAYFIQNRLRILISKTILGHHANLSVADSALKPDQPLRPR